MKKTVLALVLIFPYQVSADGDTLTQGRSADKEMGLFGVGPAYYMIRYNDEVLPEFYDSAGMVNGAVAVSGSRNATELGLELHYNYSFANGGCCPGLTMDRSTIYGFSASPFLGLYDFDDGIDGFIVGAMFGYWRSNSNYKIKPALNLGIGYTVHMDQLVLADSIVPTEHNLEQYIERKNVSGWALTFSASINF